MRALVTSLINVSITGFYIKLIYVNPISLRTSILRKHKDGTL